MSRLAGLLFGGCFALGGLLGCDQANAEGRDVGEAEHPPLMMEAERDEAGRVVVLELSKAEWKQRLSPGAFYILREHGTERAWTSPLLKPKGPGVYACLGCGLALFDAEDKFDSGTGWPSYTRPIKADHVTYHEDRSFGMLRMEVRCAGCGGHLGHVFNDGPRPTGKRYCINGDALFFVAQKDLPMPEADSAEAEADG